MGFTPQQVNAMSMWQFFSALYGYIDANTPKEGNKLTATEADDLFDWIEQGSAAAEFLSTQTYWWDDFGPQPAGIVTFTLNSPGGDHSN